MLRKFILMLVLVLCLQEIALGATIHGGIYDFSLEKVENVIVEINTQPLQRYVSKDGIYSFEVQKEGGYNITARYGIKKDKLIAEEVIEIKQEGEYRVDLFLFPETITEDTSYLPYILITGLILVISVGIYILKKKKKEIITLEVGGDDLKKVVDIIKKAGGRTTQKDLRKELLLSEAKISLMIAELEEKGKVQKIKKGRGNIIILK